MSVNEVVDHVVNKITWQYSAVNLFEVLGQTDMKVKRSMFGNWFNEYYIIFNSIGR